MSTLETRYGFSHRGLNKIEIKPASDVPASPGKVWRLPEWKRRLAPASVAAKLETPNQPFRPFKVNGGSI